MLWRHLTRGQAIAMALLALAFLGNGVWAIRNIRAVASAAAWVSHTREVLADVEGIVSTVKDAETGQRGFLLTGEDGYLAPYDQALGSIRPRLAHLEELTADNPRQTSRIREMAQLTTAKLAELGRAIDLARGDPNRETGFRAAREVVRSGEGRVLMDAIRAAARSIEQEEVALLGGREAAARASIRAAIGSSALAAVFGLVLVASAFALISRNLAARQKAAELLHTEREQFRTTLTSIGDAVIVTDVEGRVTFMNPVAASMTGWPVAEASGQALSTVFRTVNEHTGSPAEDPVARVLHEGVVVGLANDTALLSRDGRQITIEDSAAPIRATDGRTTGVVLVFHDASAKRLAEAEFRLVANASPVLIWMSGPDAGYTFFNQPWLDFTGRSLSAALGEGWIEDVHPEDREQCLATYRLAFDARESFEREYRLRRSDGEFRWILDRGTPRYRPDGRFAGYVGSGFDITDRRLGEEARRYLAAIVEGSDDAIVSKTLDGVITSWNDGAERMFGYSPSEAVGYHITLIVPPERAAEEQDILARIRRGERIHHFETVRVRKDGGRVDVSITVSPIRGAAGTIIGASKIARDISGAKALERVRGELLAREQTARAEAELANRSKDEFLAMLGHELRNPLGAISNAVHLLGDVDTGGDHGVRARDVIKRQTEHLTRLVDDLLDVGRIMAGKIVLSREPTDLAEVARRSITALTTARGLAQQEIQLDAEPVWIEADVVRIEQVVGNLLSNAIKYTPAGGRIHVTVTREGDDALIRVADTGSGIPAELLPRIFDLFVQGSQGASRAFGGLGVGLTLVRRIVELHGGTVDASSEGPGRGTTFTVRLPGALVPVPAAAAAPPPAEGRRPRRILLVEDNPDSREILHLLLRLQGHEVSEATDGPSGVAAILRDHPEVAVIDIGLPELDGYEVARQVRAHPAGRDVVLVALTGYGLASDRERAREAGFDAHLAKPLDPEKLNEMLSGLPDRSMGSGR